jgi:arylformamidase
MQQRNSYSTIYDLTAEISADSVIFPGDPSFSCEKVSSLDDGQKYNLCHMHMGNHMGTHVDFPNHTLKEGKSSSDFPIEYLTGPGIIIKVPAEEKSITKAFVTRQSIMKNDIVFFKTANSKKSKQEAFTEKYVYIEPDAAEELLQKEIKIVGIDYISVDRFDDENLTVHNILLSKEILIVEGLELAQIPEGRYQIFIAPLKIPAMDGLPARVIATPTC